MKHRASTEEKSAFLMGPILPPLVRFALPLMLSLLLQALYGGVDLAVVGHYSPTASVSAVATGSQSMQVVTGLISGLAMGATILVGKAMGAGDRDEAGAVTAGQIRLFVPVVLGLTGVMIVFAPQAAGLLNVPKEAVGETVKYIRICSGGIVFIAAYNGISGIFRGLGNSRSPFVFVLIACLVNVALDILFVGGFSMGASGAALATVLAQAASVAFSLIYMRFRPLPFCPAKGQAESKRTAGHILKLGAPIALQDFLTGMSFLIITAIVNTLGLVASAGVGIAEKLFAFLSIVPMAFMSALSTFVAHNMGAGNRRRADRSLLLASLISLAFGTAMFLLTFFGGRGLASLFDNDPQVLTATADYLRGSGVEYVICSVVFCFLGYFNGREHTAFVMTQGLVSSFLVRIPLSYYLSRLPGTGMFLISLAVPVSALVNLALCAAYLLVLKSREKKQI